MAASISRRRMIAISASFASGALTFARPSSACAKSLADRKPVTWHGIALGAEAQIVLYHDDAIAAGKVLRLCRDEISRLENLFSLFEPLSAVSELNRNGVLKNPAPEMLELVSGSLSIGCETGGAFDITVQPLWQLYADHFSTRGSAETGPSPKRIEDALGAVDFTQVEVSSRSIRFKRAGMGVTLNGIAQGYITDKVSNLLRGAGYGNVLVHLGETFGMGRKSAGGPWMAGIQDPQDRYRTVKTVALENLALATSGGYGTVFSGDGQHHHLFDPRTGRSANRYRSVSVIAPDAMSADALSTAFSSMDQRAIQKLVMRRQNVRAIVIQTNNEILEL